MMQIWIWRAAADAETRTPSARSSSASDRSCPPSAGVAESRGLTAMTWHAILLDAFRALPCYQGTSRLSTWIYSLSLRRVADHFRSPQRRDVPSGWPGDDRFRRRRRRRAPTLQMSKPSRPGGRATETCGLAPGRARTLRGPRLLFGRDVRDGDFLRAEHAGGDGQDPAPSWPSGAT